MSGMPFKDDLDRQQALLDLMSEQTDRAVKIAVACADERAHKREHRWMVRAVIGFLILFAGMLLTNYQTRQFGADARARVQKVAVAQTTQAKRAGKVVTIQGCNRDFHSTEKIRALLVVLEKANDANLKGGKITKEAHDASQRFYDSQLKSIVLPDCREATKAFNQNLDTLSPPPDPLYPGAPGTDDASS